MPKQFAQLAEDRINQIGAAEGLINSLIKDIKKAQKDFNISDDQFKTWISGTDDSAISKELPEGFTRVADGARKEIQK